MAFIVVKECTVAEVYGGTFKEEYDNTKIRKRKEEEKKKKQERPKEERREHFVNKKMVRGKVFAMFNLEQARVFMAFYTISFPIFTRDDEAYRVFNTWLTRCRKEYGEFTYIWVAERQKNGTIHYHMITTKRMKIKKVNEYMKKSIMNIKTLTEEQKEKMKKYNGVDVDNVWYPKPRAGQKRVFKRSKEHAAKMIGRYIAKYCSKQHCKFRHFAWHCSRSVSAMATSFRQYKEEVTRVAEVFYKERGNWEKREYEWGVLYLVPWGVNLLELTDIRAINQKAHDEVIMRKRAA